MAVAPVPSVAGTAGAFQRMVGVGAAVAASCGWTEPQTAGIRAVGQGAYAHSCVPLGTWTAVVAGFAVFASSSV